MRLVEHALLFLAIGAAALPWTCAHAEDTIETDRPDFVESSAVVGLAHWQIETGILSERTTSNGITTRTVTTPTLLRIGVSETVELRAEGDGLTREKTTDASTGLTQRLNGFSDVSFGAKWRVREGDAGWLPGVAWLADVETATGSSAFRGAGFRPSVRVTAEWDLPGNLSLGVMPGVFLDRNEHGKRYAAGIFAVTLGKAWTPRWRTFVEVAGERLARPQDGGSSVTFDTGLAFVATKSLQFDVAVSRGLTSTSPDLQAGLGISARF